MTRGSRITFLAIAVVIAIVAIVVLADSSEDDGGSAETAATATPTETAAPTEASPGEETPTATPTPTPEPTPPPPPLLTAEQGHRARGHRRRDGALPRALRRRTTTCTSTATTSSKDAPAGETITMSFKATITGIFEIEFEDAGKEIGKLTVEQNRRTVTP